MKIVNPSAVGNPAEAPIIRLDAAEAIALLGQWRCGDHTNAVRVPGAAAAPDDPGCNDSDGWYQCTRRPDHKGRHMAAIDFAGAIVAAWPGRDAPTPADLA